MEKKMIFRIVGLIIIIILIIYGINQFMARRSQKKMQMTQERIDAIYEYAASRYEEKDYDRAIGPYEFISNEESAGAKREDAILKLVTIYEEKNYLIKSREYSKKYLKLFPDSEFVSDMQAKVEELNMRILFSTIITDDSVNYVVQEGDTLGKIAIIKGTTVELIRKSNGLKNDIIRPGQTLKVMNAKFSVLVDKSQNLLFLKKNGEVFKTYVVSTGSNFSTPEGKFTIQEKMISPVWYKIGAVVSPTSAEYELGTRWMGLSADGYGIHGTNDPGSIGKHITKGCVRMINKEVEELYSILPSGTEVEIVE